jgi:hypothetical protein
MESSEEESKRSILAQKTLILKYDCQGIRSLDGANDSCRKKSTVRNNFISLP